MTDEKKMFRKLCDLLRQEGADVIRAKSGHWRVTRNGVFVATLPGTPSDHRSMLNTISFLRRQGFQMGKA